MLLQTLIEFGLSEKEAKIYLALLELEVATANDIAQKSGVNRSSTYVVLEALKKLGLVGISGEKPVQKYVATSPEVLLKMAKEKAGKQKDIEEKVTEILPELKALHKDTKHRPKVYVYTGQETVRMGFYDIFDEQVSKGMKKFRVYEDMSEVTRLTPPDFIKNDVLLLKKSGAKMFVISPDNKESISVIKEYKSQGSTDEFAIIPKSKFNQTKRSALGLSIYKDKVEFFSEDLSLIIIESQEIADTLKNVFDLAWEESKRLEKGV